MNQSDHQIRQVADEILPPESGKQSIVLLDDASTKIVLFFHEIISIERLKELPEGLKR